METIYEKIQQELISYMGKKSTDEMTVESRLVEDLGVDSLDLVELVLFLEEEFNIEINDDEVKKFKTVADLYAIVLGSTHQRLPMSCETAKEKTS